MHALTRDLPAGVLERVRSAGARLRHYGRSRYCPLCRSRLRRFQPYGLPPRPEAFCPVCSSVERHRLIWLYLRQRAQLWDGQPRRLLHLAPERSLERRLREIRGLTYLSGDPVQPHAMVKLDLTQLQFADNSFDILLCSYVLAVIPDDAQALREIFRVLRPGGWALLHERIRGPHTVQDPHADTPARRQQAHSDPDYLRLYGRDFADRLAAAGFDVEIVPYGDELGKAAAVRYGLGTESEIWRAHKPGPPPGAQLVPGR